MKRKTYRIFIVLAIIVIFLSCGIAARGLITEWLHGHIASETAEHPVVSEQNKAEEAIPSDSIFEIHFFDVGETDSSLAACDGHYMLIDGGYPGSSRFLYAYLEAHDITHLEYIICTHAHENHVGGLSGALNYATVDTAYAPVTEADGREYYLFSQDYRKGVQEFYKSGTDLLPDGKSAQGSFFPQIIITLRDCVIGTGDFPFTKGILDTWSLSDFPE